MEKKTRIKQKTDDLKFVDVQKPGEGFVDHKYKVKKDGEKYKWNNREYPKPKEVIDSSSKVVKLKPPKNTGILLPIKEVKRAYAMYEPDPLPSMPKKKKAVKETMDSIIKDSNSIYDGMTHKDAQELYKKNKSEYDAEVKKQKQKDFNNSVTNTTGEFSQTYLRPVVEEGLTSVLLGPLLGGSAGSLLGRPLRKKVIGAGTGVVAENFMENALFNSVDAMNTGNTSTLKRGVMNGLFNATAIPEYIKDFADERIDDAQDIYNRVTPKSYDEAIKLQSQPRWSKQYFFNKD